MKKLLAFFCVALAAVSLGFSEITFGGRVFGEWGIGSDIKYDDVKLNLAKSWDFGGAVFGKIPVSVVENLYVQPELGFQHSTIGMKWDDSKFTYSYNAFILPVLISYDFPINQSFIAFIEAGPQLSFIVGKISAKGDGEEGDFTPDSRFLFSAVLGGGASYSFSPAVALLGDLRYDLGFSRVRAKDGDDGVVPRGLTLSAGLQVRF